MKYEALDDLKLIKKYYGEKMSHLCRDLFSSILETPGLLYKIISDNFHPSKSLYNDIMSEGKQILFKNYIYFFFDGKQEEIISNKSVKELLDSVGYDIYECKNHEDVLKFKKYYADEEALCTFRDPSRINNYHIFFIVKKNVDEIKREDFKEPIREDKYGTSVLDLQFDKGKNQRVSIKSRYNHKVMNPDATYSNNLDNIVEGLTDAFERDYGFNIGNEYKTNFELGHYVKANDGKFYKYNYEMFNVHFCPDNIVIDGKGNVIETFRDKSRYLVFDYFVLDKQEKNLVIPLLSIKDGLLKLFKHINKIEITKKDNVKELRVICDDTGETIITLDENNKIIGFENNIVEELSKCFLSSNLYISDIRLPSLKKCDDFFLFDNTRLKSLTLPKLEECGYGFIARGNLTQLSLPSLKKCDACFLGECKFMKELHLPELEICGNSFLYSNTSIERLELPSLVECGNAFLMFNESLKELYAPNLEKVGDNFLVYNESLNNINMPKLKEHGKNFLYDLYKYFKRRQIINDDIKIGRL